MSANTDNVMSQALKEFKLSSLSDKIFLCLLIVVPVAVGASLLNLPALVVFILAAIAVIALAKVVSDSTEALATHTGATIGGLLTATFGNAVELIIAILALFNGLTEVVKASITGSLIGNILFVLGLSMFFGGVSRKTQSFNRMAASLSASQLFLAGIALVIPAVFNSTTRSSNNGPDLLEELSLLVSVILIICYVGQLIFFLVTHSNLAAGEESSSASASSEDDGDPVEEANKISAEQRNEEVERVGHWSVMRSMVTLVVATVIVGFISEILVSSIEPVTKSLGWTELFVGVIFLAIIGNAAEYVAAITAAVKNNMSLSVNIAIGSSLQMAFFVAPILVFVGFFSGHPLSLRFEEFELVCLVVSIIIVNLVALDGKSNWLEGLQLIGAYFIIAVAFFLHP
ncbi:MAG TPA: calcium/proton exchanger [Chloroflexia bacterium]|nr:calcium/proton exchanger [Chloroflexia bacterium]